MSEASLCVSGIYPITTGRGKEKLVSFLIEKGIVKTEHSPGEEPYYNIVMANGYLRPVKIVDAYCKKTRDYLEAGQYVSFYFPLDVDIPKIGERCMVE